MIDKPLITTVLIAIGGTFFLMGAVLLALGLHWAFWGPAFVVGTLNLLAAYLFLRSR